MEVSVTCCAISLHPPQASAVANATAMGDGCARSNATEANQRIPQSLFFHESLPIDIARIGGNALQSLDSGREPRLHHRGMAPSCRRREWGSTAFHFVLCHTHVSAALPLVGIDCEFGWEEEPAARRRPSVRRRVAQGSLVSWKRDSSAMAACDQTGAQSLRESCLAMSPKDTADAFPPRSVGGQQPTHGFSFSKKERTRRGGNEFVGSGGTAQRLGCAGERTASGMGCGQAWMAKRRLGERSDSARTRRTGVDTLLSPKMSDDRMLVYREEEAKRTFAIAA